MPMDMDTEDRVVRVRRCWRGLIDLMQSGDVDAKMGDIASLMQLVLDEDERALPTGGRPPRASNDEDED